ncbi:MAG: CCA tRNA nucleotidyltransferase [Elusimicrobia bacterium]|nr:CCA tRNA nucleotidyltransferase [Elusimicrobiota bacterium]
MLIKAPLWEHLPAARRANALAADLAGRDITINSMAVAGGCVGRTISKRSIIDPAKGLNDLKRGLIRTANEKNLSADPLRLLRVFRFSAQLGFRLDRQTLEWVKKNAVKIRLAAPERIRFELMTLLETKNAAKTLEAMDRAGLLTKIIHALERSRDFALQYHKHGGALGHALDAARCFEESVGGIPKRMPALSRQILSYLDSSIGGGFSRYALIKLAILCHDIAKPHTAKIIDGRLRFFGHEKRGAGLFEKIGRRLRFSGSEIQLIAKIIAAHLTGGVPPCGQNNILEDRCKPAVQVGNFFIAKIFFHRAVLEKIRGLQAEGKIQTKNQALKAIEKAGGGEKGKGG